MKAHLTGAVVLCLIGSTAPVLAVCQGGTVLPEISGKRIVLTDDALFFRTQNLELDLDGSPSAYGKDDQGTDTICDGLAPLTPPECKGVASRKCTPACNAAFRRWHDGGAKLDDLAAFMCAIGLGGSGCSTPEVRLQGPPRTDWFVSETSLKLVPPAGTALGDWLPKQDAQLNATNIPYFVIPGRFRRLPWGATPGDVGVIVAGPGASAIGFIVGDEGGKLDEASARLIELVRGKDSLPTVSSTSALGNRVTRLVGAATGDFRVAIFRHSAVLFATKVVGKSADELPCWIDDTTAKRLAAIGGVDRVRACTEP